jgi:hypothetical protein
MISTKMVLLSSVLARRRLIIGCGKIAEKVVKKRTATWSDKKMVFDYLRAKKLKIVLADRESRRARGKRVRSPEPEYENFPVNLAGYSSDSDVTSAEEEASAVEAEVSAAEEEASPAEEELSSAEEEALADEDSSHSDHSASASSDQWGHHSEDEEDLNRSYEENYIRDF